ncbi:MAG: NAD-dependent epimerase/dehydratase family protein [Alphaproteobacteria bacterium]
MVSRSERVLLTGSGGFTGRPLAKRLRQDGHDVIGITRTPAERGEIQGDLRDMDFVRRAAADIRPTAVIHLAGIAAPLHDNLGEIYSVNVAGTANLLSALAELAERPRRVVVASSATVYAAPKDDSPIAEDSALSPQTHYGASKRAMEDVARLFADRLPIIVTRPFNYTGPGQEPIFLVPKLVDHFIRRAPRINLGNLDLFRDFSDIGRVVDVYARMVSQPVDHAVVNICSGRTIHLASMIGLLQEISGHSIEVATDPALVRPGEPRTICGSAARLQSMFGDLPNPDFGDTLRSMYESRR